MRVTRCLGLLVAVAAGCGSSGGGGGGDDGGTAGPDAFAGPWSDFPAGPIIDPGGVTPAPPGAPGLFGDPASGDPSGGPCLIEPEIGTLFPSNWLRPRFTWMPGAGENLFELRITTPTQVNPLVVYTTATQWTMPAGMWNGLSDHSVDVPLVVTVRGAAWDGNQLTAGPSLGSSGGIEIAPAKAPGAIVYWTTSGGSAFRGFHVGDESVRDIVRPSQAGTACVGCHSSTPDGMFVGFSASPVAGNGDPATLGMRTADGTVTEPPFLTASARTLMARQNQEQPVFSAMHWQTGDHVAITMFPVAGKFEIMWTDLEATSTAQNQGWGVLGRGTDTNPAAYASFFHQSDQLLYVSATAVSSGVTVSQGNLMTVPYGARAGGAAAPVSGADTAMWNEYYPTVSPDDRYIAFNRVASGSSSYNNSQAEVFVIPAGGGAPARLAANDPPTCSGRTSPGVTNSWPKWAPEVTEIGARRFYWMIFSSTRTAGRPQLFVTPVVDDGGTVRTYPALYLWNQPATESNHTPAWDNFDIGVGRVR